MTNDGATHIQLDPEKQPAASMLIDALSPMRNDASPEGRAKFEADLVVLLGYVVKAVGGLELELRAAESRIAELEKKAPGAAGTGTHEIK